jgi:hypothetical protein
MCGSEQQHHAEARLNESSKRFHLFFLVGLSVYLLMAAGAVARVALIIQLPKRSLKAGLRAG